MRTLRLFHRTGRRAKCQKGMVLILVMSFMALMIMGAVALSTMIQRDVGLIRRAKEKEQAILVAEAGIYHALAKIRQDGFESRADFEGSLDTGDYSVSFSEIGGRHLVTSTGEVSGVSARVSAELKSPFDDTVFHNFSTAGNNIWIKVHTNVTAASIKGNIHANNNVNLVSQPHSHLAITGDYTSNAKVSATGLVIEGNKHDQNDNKDDDIEINSLTDDQATVYEGEERINIPNFDYQKYKEAAEDSGDYYSSNQTFNNETLSPGNGIVYVDGNATISGTVILNGGMIADNITINGTLDQKKSGDRLVIVAKEEDVTIGGKLAAEEVVIYAERDISTYEDWGAEVVINGVLIAKRDIRMWNFKTEITYAHVYILPPDLIE
ncbi:MAG: hypothetical protein U9R44_00585 [Candidatus Omnitrophota bacterium]|nr:hypothetical protein [Candidatus Omnitrophota bacterium]